MLVANIDIDNLTNYVNRYEWRHYCRHGWSTWMAIEIVILVGNTIGRTITEIDGDAVADVDHDVIDNMNGRHK